MKINLQLKEFDSSLFGYKIGAAEFINVSEKELNDFQMDLKKNKFKLVYCYPKDEISAFLLNKIGAIAIDYKCTYLKEKVESFQSNKYITPYSKYHSFKELYSLTLQSGIFSRFNLDPGFINNEFENLYRVWIEKSITKEIADDIIVYSENQTILGFISYKIKDTICELSLIAVDKDARKKGIGKSLLKEFELLCNKKGIGQIKVATQLKNKMANQFYESNGFKLINVETIYHLWI